MFGRSFKPAKCKTALRLAISRIKLMKNKRELQLKQTRRDLAQLLQSGQEPSARIRVEHVMREQNIIGAYEFIELFCELIVARLPIIESQKNCPNDLREAISSLIFAAPRCADIPELSEIRSHFGLKYGKEFVASAAELRPDCGVNRTIIEKLSARTPSGEEKLKIMKEIAKEHQIEWDPSEAEKDLFKPPEDLLNGPSKFVGATKIPTEPKKESYQSVSGKEKEPDSQVFTRKIPKSSGTPSNEDSQSEKRYGTDSSLSSDNIEQKPIQTPAREKSTKDTNLHQENLENRSFHSLSSGKRNTLAPRSTPGDEYDSSQQSASYRIDQSDASVASSNVSNEIGVSNSEEWNMNFKDVASAARAAAYSAEMASEAAKAAAELSKLSTLQKKDSKKIRTTSFSPSSSDGETTELNNSRITRRPSSNEYLQPSTLQKKDSRKTGTTSFSPSSSDGETMELNTSRITRRPSSNEYVQPENQPLHGNDFSGRHYVDIHSENAKSHHSASWQSSRQKGAGDIDNEYALPMKNVSRLESYQWPSDDITDDDIMPSTRKSASIRREGRHYIESKEEKPHAKKDSDFSNSENAKSHHSASWQKGAGDIDNEYALPMKSVSRLESYQWPSDDITDDDIMPSTRKSASIRREGRHYIDSKEEKPHAKKDTDFSNTVDGSRPWKMDTMTSHLNTRPSEDFYDSFNKRPEESRNTVTKLPLFDDSPHSVQSDIKWIPQKNEQDSVVKSSTMDEVHNNPYQPNPAFAPPMRPPPDVPESSKAHTQYTFSNNNIPLDKVSTPPGNASYDSSSSEDDMSNSRMRAKPSSNDLNDRDHFGWHSAETHEKSGKPQGKVHHQNEIANAGNEYNVSMKRTIRTDPDGNKSQPFRREQEGQINSGGTNRQQTDIRKSVEEPLSRKGNTTDSRLNTQTSDIFSDSDRVTSESDEETELETHNGNGRNIHRLPLFSNSSHSSSSNSKHGNPKHTEKVSTSTLSSVNEDRAYLSQPNPQFQPPKQSLSGFTASSEASSQSTSSAGQSIVQRRATHVHPKLPDYDDLAAKFASMKRQ